MRVTAEWSGFNGAPGYSVFHLRDFSTGEEPTVAQAEGAITRIRTFFDSVDTLLGGGISIQISNEVEVIEDTTGTLQDVLVSTIANAPIVASTTANVAGPAGAVINWRTNSIRNGRRIRGRTFLVPLHIGAYAPDGSLSPTALNDLRIAANNLAANTGTPDIGVYARPSSSLASDGQWAVAASASVPDMVAVLRSRRG